MFSGLILGTRTLFQPGDLPPILDDLEEWERPLVDLLETPGIVVLGLFDQDREFVGKAIIDQDPGVAVWLENVYILKDRRRQGFARLLIEDLQAIAELPVRLFPYSIESERVWLNFGFKSVNNEFLQYA